MSCPPCRFIIPTPKGATVSAPCLKCGEEKTWPASLEDIQVKTGWKAAAAARLKEKVT